MDWVAQPRQEKFLREVFNFDDDAADEILYGGAAGGGKTDALLIAAIVWCQMFPGAWVLFLRRTFRELEEKPIPRSKELLPASVARYHETKHRWVFNGRRKSVIQFGSLDKAGDETKYQSSEYSLIIFDELTHFQERQYLYMLSRNRTTDPRIRKPKVIAGTNPGNIGHVWVKSRWIDPAEPEKVWEAPFAVDLSNWAGLFPVEQIKPRRRLFIPAKVFDNQILLRADPGYLARLLELPEAERRALLEGDWDVFSGQYYPEWRREIHVIQPFTIPHYWRRFRSLDYGLDMTACYWWAVDQSGKAYCYRELYQPNLSLTQAAKKIVEMTPADEKIAYTVASPDLWNRRQEKGIPGVQYMIEAGLTGLQRANDERIPGWRALREYLQPYPDPDTGKMTARLQVFSTCYHLIRTLPALVHDETNVEDVSDKCEDHAAEAVRYFVMSRPGRSPSEEEYRRRQSRRSRIIRPGISEITGY
ncbi:MAG TPA: Terminase-like family protein [Syntrophomonadaceae bacterium]|nr:Terminase-like family protein [Syntrophomonadaceae bacterium]